MNIKPLLKKTFEPMRCPAAPISYKGEAAEYITYMQYNELPESASGKHYKEATYGQATIWADKPPSELVEEAIQRLRANGFKATRAAEGENDELKKFYAVIDLWYENEVAG